MSNHGLFQITQKIFIVHNNQVLVMKDHKSGAGDLPGGRMDQGEFFEDWMNSLNREMLEEMGSDFKIEINSEPIFIHKHLVNIGNHPCLVIAYIAKYISGEIKISDEHDYFKWVSIDSYNPEELFSEYMLDIMNLFLKRFRNGIYK